MAEAWQRAPTWIDLYDWRQRVAALFAARDVSLRAGMAPEAAWQTWRAGRDDLFAHHPQSPLSDTIRQSFTALPSFPYDRSGPRPPGGPSRGRFGPHHQPQHRGFAGWRASGGERSWAGDDVYGDVAARGCCA